MAEKTAFLDFRLEMAKTKDSERFAEIETTEDEKKQRSLIKAFSVIS